MGRLMIGILLGNLQTAVDGMKKNRPDLSWEENAWGSCLERMESEEKPIDIPWVPRSPFLWVKRLLTC
jgi:hypothetical protein